MDRRRVGVLLVVLLFVGVWAAQGALVSTTATSVGPTPTTEAVARVTPVPTAVVVEDPEPEAAPDVVPATRWVDWDVPDAAPAVQRFDPSDDERLTVYEARVDPATGGRVTGPDGVELIFPADGLTLRGGIALDGPVEVRWTHVASPHLVTTVPGNLAVRIEGVNVPLQSYGMARVELFHPDGEVVLETPAKLSFPLAPDHGLHDGQEVGIYVLDPQSGIWVHEGDGTVAGDRFTGIAMSRQGWWNCDAPLRARGCVRGSIAHTGWKLPSNTAAHLVGLEYMTRSVAYPDQDGGFCVDGMPEVPARIEAYQTGKSCFRIESAMVEASAAGTSCFVDPGACTPVELRPVSVSCELAKDAAAQLAANPEQQQAGAGRVVDDLTRGVGRGSLRAEAPEGTTWAMLRCGGMYRQLVENAGPSFTFDHVPLAADCTLALGDGQHAWVFGGLAGNEWLACKLKGKSMRCTSTSGSDLLAEAEAPR